MAESRPYRIDYDNLDVVDLVDQIRARVGAGDDPRVPATSSDQQLRERLRAYLELDDEARPTLERSLGLTGGWNVSPDDLRASHPGIAGRLIRGLRRLTRIPFKLVANLDLPVHKQHRINLGIAAALHDLLRENAALRRRVRELAERVEAGAEAPARGPRDSRH